MVIEERGSKVKPYPEYTDKPGAAGVDQDAVTKEQLASSLSELANSLNSFIRMASALLVELASARKEGEGATSEQ